MARRVGVDKGVRVSVDVDILVDEEFQTWMDVDGSLRRFE